MRSTSSISSPNQLHDDERAIFPLAHLARTWYSLDAIPNLSVHCADGAEFVSRMAPETIDVVVIDVFDGQVPAASLCMRTFFQALRRAARPGGAVAFNVIGALAERGPVQAVASALGAAFDEVRVLPVMAAKEAYSPEDTRNVVLVATRSR